MSIEIKKSNCHYCGYLCGFNATVEDGRLVALDPDPDRYPYDPSVIARCRRWRMNLTEIDGAGRINYPLKRVGERGSGQFERVTWDEALDDISKRLLDLRERYGGKTLASAIGGPHATYWPLHRFLSLYGSPNNMGIGQICWNPRVWMDAVTCGWPTEQEVDPNLTKAVILWGTNPAESDNSLFWSVLKQMQESGVPLIVVDSRLSRTARAADYHLMPRPGTDCYLTLAMMNVIIEEDLYDHAFVKNWCYGFDGLRAHVAAYTPEVAQRETGVPADDIRTVARVFANAEPAVLLSGRGVDQLGPNTPPTVRSFSILRAITGNIDKRGGCYIQDMSDFTPEVELEMTDRLSEEGRAAQLNLGHSPLQSYPGYDGVDAETARLGKHLPVRYLTSAHPGLVFDAMVTGDPYPVKALIVMAANPIVTYANSHKVIEGIKQLDLMVVLEYYMTPTAQLADYVLPIAGAFERPVCQVHGGVANFAYGGAAAVKPYHERKTDYEVFYGLACRMGQQDAWPDATLDAAYDRMFADAGCTFNQFAEAGIYAPPVRYHKHVDRDPETGIGYAFSTPTGKVELKSTYLASLGGQAYPAPVDEAIAHADVDAGRAVLITGARKQPYWASSYFQNPEFRTLHPEPLVTINEATCRRLGVAEGDWVELSNERGCVRQKVTLGTLPDGVISAEYGWWYPEETPGLPHLSGALRCNINVLTANDIENCEPMIGSWTYNGLTVNVRRAEGEPSPETDAY